MKRFICLSLYDARKLPGFSEIEETFYCNQYSSSIFETDGKKLIRHVAADGGEPEDQTFGRDLKWMIRELNNLVQEVENTKDELDQTRDQLNDVSDRYDMVKD